MTDEPIKPGPQLARDPRFASPEARDAPTGTRIYINNRWHRRDGNLHGRPPYFLDNATGLLVRPT